MNEPPRVLIVDDDPIIRESLSRDLAGLGYLVVSAPDGEAGLETIVSTQVDVALIDLFMPKMNGFTLLQKIEEARTDTVSIILTGDGDIAKAVEATRLGAFDFIMKPVTVQAIQRAIERALKHRKILIRARRMSLAAQQWENTFDSWPDLVVILDEEFRILRANDAAAARTDCDKQDIIGQDCHEALCANDHDVEECPFSERTCGNDGEPTVMQLGEWGGYFEFTSAPLKDSSGRIWGSLRIARDVTNRVKANHALVRMHRETENLLASISAILIGVDLDNRVTQWNSAAERAFGIQTEWAMGKLFSEFHIAWEWPELLDLIREAKDKRTTRRVEDFKCFYSDGRERYLTLTVNLVANDQGECSGLVVLGTDTTERKLLETQLAHAQKLESIGLLAAGIAHEINTPTQYVDSNINFLKTAFEGIRGHLDSCSRIMNDAAKDTRDAGLVEKLRASEKKADVEYLTEEVPRAIADALEGVKRVSRIVGAMKEFSHPGRSDKTATDINRVIESAITVSRNEWKYVAEVEKSLDPDLPMVPCLKDDLSQAILNMIVNAAHAVREVVGDGSQGKGVISIETSMTKDLAEIRIRDTGCGIREEHQGKLFDPFFTTKDVGHGTGQGLAIVHDIIVRKHGGTVTFETELGKGTTFITRIPISPEASTKETQNEAACLVR